MTSIEVVDFSFTYDKNQPNILNNVSFTPQTNSFNLLVGPSGSGKSTLLKAMAGWLPKFGGIVTHGQIRLENQDIQPVAPFERAKRIAMLFQNPDRQFAMQTIPEQITFALENIQFPIVDIATRVDWAMTQLNLHPLADRQLMTLSGGEKQRVALATILAMDSDIILLDEPFANVDPVARLTLLQDLKHLQQTHQKTIIISDHDYAGYQGLVDDLWAIDETSRSLVTADLTILNNIPPITPFMGHPQHPGALHWDNLKLQIGERLLLRDANFTVPQQEIGLISGANGIGKSTLFAALAKLHAFEGHVTWQEQSITAIKAKHWATHLALVFQSATDQFVTMTVADELALAQKHSHFPTYWTTERVQQALATLHLATLQDHIVYQLSGGQQKKLQVLLMLITGQDVLLLDEPLAGLDSASTKAIMTLLKSTLAETKQAILMISHQRAGLADFINYELHFADQQLQLIGGGQTYV